MAAERKIVVITSKQEFDLAFKEFEESARIVYTNTTANNATTASNASTAGVNAGVATTITTAGPTYHHVGLDIEYICRDNHPKSFEQSSRWTLQADKIAVCKLQLATALYSLIIDLVMLKCVWPKTLRVVLESEGWIKTGVGIHHDMALLAFNFNLKQCNSVFDLKTIGSLFYGIGRPSLGNVYQELIGRPSLKTSVASAVGASSADGAGGGAANADAAATSMVGVASDKSKSKCQQLDWSKPLTREQIEYASNDAIMSFEIGRVFLNSIYCSARNLQPRAAIDPKARPEGRLSGPPALSEPEGRPSEPTALERLDMMERKTEETWNNITKCISDIQQIASSALNDAADVQKIATNALNDAVGPKDAGGPEGRSLGPPAIIAATTSAMETVVFTPLASNNNYIGKLQEYMQSRKVSLPEYTVVPSDRPDKQFKVVCKHPFGTSIGYASKKQDAKMKAAEDSYVTVLMM